MICWAFVPHSLSHAQKVTDIPAYETAESEIIAAWDEPWVFWASTQAPPTWPLKELPASQDLLALLPASDDERSTPAEALIQNSLRDENDRVLLLRTPDASLKTEGNWWSGTRAPYSSFTEQNWYLKLEGWEKSRKRQMRKKKRQYSRTQLVFPTGLPLHERPPEDLQATPEEDRRFTVKDPTKRPNEAGLKTMYFVRSFEVDDPSRFKSLQAQVRFNKGVQVFLNGKRILSDRMNPQAMGHNDYGVDPKTPDFIWTDVGSNDRWQYHWNDISPEHLKKGENVIAAVVNKATYGGSPSLYFDLQLRGWTEFGLIKAPYLHHVTQDAVTISWESVGPGPARIDLLDSTGTVTRSVMSQSDDSFHEVRIKNLNSSTAYRYRIAIGVPRIRANGRAELRFHPQTKPAQFFTAPGENDPFNFLFIGDSRFGASVHRQLSDLMLADHHKHKANLLLHAGDIVTTGFSWDLWQERFFAPAQDLLRQVPIYPTPGNHEINQRLYYDYFDLPHNEAWYHVRYGMVDFYSINSNVDYRKGSEQYEWLQKVLQEGQARWKVALLHHPPYSCARGRKKEGEHLREHIVPLLEQYGVHLALLGHDHVYGRSRDINGVTYVISGGGGSPLYTSVLDDYMVKCEKAYNYVRFHVSEDEIQWEAIDENGGLLESYSIPH